MSEEKATGTAARPALKVGGFYKVTKPTSSYFGQVGLLRSVITSSDGAPVGLRPLWIEFIVWSGLYHYHTQCDFAIDDVETYESKGTEPQTPQDDIEQMRKALDEVQTNQAEHATHLDRLEHRTDALRSNAAADRLVIRKYAELAKEWCDTIEAHRVWLLKIEEAIDAMHYRRMVGNLFRRVADAVDGG